MRNGSIGYDTYKEGFCLGEKDLSKIQNKYKKYSLKEVLSKNQVLEYRKATKKRKEEEVNFLDLPWKGESIDSLPHIDRDGNIESTLEFCCVDSKSYDVGMNDIKIKHSVVQNAHFVRAMVSLSISTSLVENLRFENCYIGSLEITDCGVREEVTDDMAVIVSRQIAIKTLFVTKMVIKNGEVIVLRTYEDGREIDLVGDPERLRQYNVKI